MLFPRIVFDMRPMLLDRAQEVIEEGAPAAKLVRSSR
jgi:hypothetical protein